MGDIVFNVAKGAANYYATLPATNDAIIAVPLEASGLVTDAVMKDYDTLAAVLAGASNEQTTLGRKTLANVTVTTNDGTDVRSFTADAWTYTTGGGSAAGKMLICYDPDTTGGDDSTIVPLLALDWTVTPDGSDITVTPDASGLYVAS